MGTGKTIAASVVLGVALAAALGGAGCANSTEGDPTPVRTFKITPAAQPRTVSAAIPSPAAATGSAGSAIDVIGRDTKFDVTDVTSSSGDVTIRFDNRDPGVVHNLHVFRGTNVQGESAGQTAFAPGPVKQELQLNLAAGTYFFQCDAHPTTMKGTLTVR